MGTLIFGNDKKSRGCYVEMMQKVGVIGGATLTLPGGGMLPANSTDPVFITGVNIAQKERYSIVQCFNNKNYAYAFGHDPTVSVMNVTFIVFMSTQGGTVFGDSLKTMLNAYKNARISESTKYATLSIGHLAVQGFVVGMDSGTVDTEHNTQSFTVQILLVEAQGG